MTKIMLVEDDKNLREIYSARLMAEGYQIVSAADGEEALALAVKEKPELIVADVMMPKISGFDMLDILRTTPETKNTKIIIMTALSQPEDRARGEALGADKYLVKSQVTLEDVVAAVHEILGDGGASAASASASETMPSGAPSPAPASPPPPLAAPAPPPPAPEPTPAPDNQPPKVEGADDAPESASHKSRVIAPINDLSHDKENFLKMVAEEEALEKQSTPGAAIGPADDATLDEQQTKLAATVAEEKKQMEDDVKQMLNNGAIDDEAAAPSVDPAAANGDGTPAAPPEEDSPGAPPPAEPTQGDDSPSDQPEPGVSVAPEPGATPASPGGDEAGGDTAGQPPAAPDTPAAPAKEAPEAPTPSEPAPADGQPGANHNDVAL